MLAKFWILFTLFLGVLALKGEKELEFDITKKIPIAKCQLKALPGDTVSVHYTGMLASNDKVFDSSIKRGVPIEFQLGAGRVIQGWEKGIEGMCLGEKRTLYIPPHMAYGARGIPGVIPENAVLKFDVELVKVKN
ncbi:Peptidyl-prolyl cis-trans isomerase FPR2 [Nakaseomyces bracarensis]|uniref:peptidylprolyl isomerase n=1 Tax=Nakaseomyces bracarensis TaxID=273131 RepID=A0ABR4NTY9_9SACH